MKPRLPIASMVSGRRGLTFAEVLAAMVFVAVVVPVSVHAIQAAKWAGVEADRRREATRLAERLLNDFVVTGDWAQGDQSGQFAAEDAPISSAEQPWRWQLTSEEWQDYPLNLVTVEVFYQVRGQERSVRLSTAAEEEEGEQ